MSLFVSRVAIIPQPGPRYSLRRISRGNLNVHSGQDSDQVEDGRLLVFIGGCELELNVGDSRYFDSSLDSTF